MPAMLSAQIVGPEQVERAVQMLWEGKLVVFPTDTVYGVAALALDATAAQKIYEVKQRPHNMALPVMVAEPGRVAAVAHEAPGFRSLARAFWPGPLTLILPKTAAIPEIVTAGGDTIALRIPDHPLALKLLQSIDAPLAVTSANRSGRPPACTAQEAQAQFAGMDVLIVDGGAAPQKRPSTILDLTTAPPRLLRLGSVSAAEIAEVLGHSPILAPPS